MIDDYKEDLDMNPLQDGLLLDAARRQRAVQLEAVAMKERRAQAVCLRQGVSVMRRGFGKLD